MEIFYDGVDLSEASSWVDSGVVSGVTTNPILLRAGNIDPNKGSQLTKLCEVLDPAPVSIQVTARSTDELASKAKAIASIGSNVVVKIPVCLPDGVSLLPQIKSLVDDGVDVNVTACLSGGQAIFAAQTGARFVSLLAGRIADEGGDPIAAIEVTRNWIDDAGLSTKVVVASVRSPGDFYECVQGRPHVFTLTNTVLEKLSRHNMAQATVAQMLGDA